MSPAPEASAPVSAPQSEAAPQAKTPAEAALSPAANDDWRSKYAGGDTKKIEALSRYKTESDWANSWFEQRAALAKRAEPVRLADNATPEQVAEYRKWLGFPEIGADAKSDAYLDAYKIAIPDGYEASDLEKGMLGDFAKLAYDKGWSPAEVKGATDFFFKQQAASVQALNQVNVGKQQEWQQQLRQEFGRDYDDHIAAATAMFDKLVGDDQGLKAEILHAQLPGGGKLGDHPMFAKLLTDLAMQNGFSDRIEAKSYESGGRSLAEQQAEIEKLMTTDPTKYNLPETQAKLSKIYELRQKRGEIDEFGVEAKRRRSA